MNHAPSNQLNQALTNHQAKEAVRLLAMEYSDWVYGVCRKMLGRDHDAGDAFQKTFEKAYRALVRGVVVAAPFTWLMTIARNTCNDMLKARRREELAINFDREADAIDEKPAGAQGDVDTEEMERNQSLQACLKALPERSRTPINIRFLNKDGKTRTYEEICELLGEEKPNTVRMRVKAGLVLIRECMRRKGADR